MKMTQGLLPASKVSDGKDNVLASHPWEHGGVELGTWNFDHPWKGLNIKYNIREVGECGYGVQCCHKFTPEECNQVVEKLKATKETYTKRGYKRLIELFSNTDDPPVYYWAD